MNAAIPTGMDVARSCRCCLRRAPDKGLTTPYTHLGNTEIYSDMLKECFEIHLILDSETEVGICDVCVGRLRDASAFKLQVQRSQAELHAWLQDTLQVKGEDTSVKLEVVEHVKTSGKTEKLMLHEEFIIEPDFKYEGTSNEEPAAESEASGDAASDDCASLARAGAGQADSLRRHYATYTGRSPYGCDVCHKQFTRKSHLKTHTLIHGEKPHICGICGKRFTQKCNLIVHIRTHTGEKPYTCDVCIKSFADISTLRNHQRIHTGEKRFTCNICNKQFIKKCDVTKHIRSHTGEKPYTCDVCSKTFARNSNLRRHQRIHTVNKF